MGCASPWRESKCGGDSKMSDLIKVTGIWGFGYHGVFEHEAKNGQDFFVDLENK